MIIVGNLHKLNGFLPWQPFVEHCIKNGLVRKGDLNGDGNIERIRALRIENSSESSEEEEEEEDDLSDDDSDEDQDFINSI